MPRELQDVSFDFSQALFYSEQIPKELKYIFKYIYVDESQEDVYLINSSCLENKKENWNVILLKHDHTSLGHSLYDMWLCIC